MRSFGPIRFAIPAAPRHAARRMAAAALLLALRPEPAGAQAPRPIYSFLGELGEGGVRALGESPGGRFVLYGVTGPRGGPGDARIFDREDGRWSRLGTGGAGVSWSPRGDRLAYAGADEAGAGSYVWVQVVNGETARPSGGPRRASGGQGRDPVFSPDGEWLAFAAMEEGESTGPRVLLTPAAGGESRVLLQGTGAVQRLSWSPDGRWLYFLQRPPCCAPATISRISIGGGDAEPVRPAAEFLGISPDGRFLAYRPVEEARAGADRLVAVATLDGVEVTRFQLPHTLTARAWAATGWKLLASRSEPRSSIHTLALAGGVVEGPATLHAFPTAPAWSPTGRQLAFVGDLGGEDQLMIMDARGRGPRLQVPTRRLPARRAPLWSPDGRHLAFVSRDGGALSVVELATGVESELDGAERFEDVAWRRNAAGLIVVRREGARVEVREVSLGGAERVLRPLDGPLQEPRRVTLVGDSLLLVTTRAAVYLAPARGEGHRLLHTPGAGETIRPDGRGIAISPDGRWSALRVSSTSETGGARQLIRLAPLGAGSGRALEVDLLPDAELLAWHPDGRRLVVLGRRQPEQRAEVYLVPVDGGPWRSVTTSEASREIRDVALSPDGRHIAYSASPGMPTSLWEIDLIRVLAAYTVA